MLVTFSISSQFQFLIEIMQYDDEKPNYPPDVLEKYTMLRTKTKIVHNILKLPESETVIQG